MSTRPTPQQRPGFLEKTVAYDELASTGLAERLLELSDAARAFAADRAWLDGSTRRRLLAELRDDRLCEKARLVAASEGEHLWRELLDRATPPDDVGPALMLAISLDARCAADEARDVIDAVLRPGEYRRWALELGFDLAQDGGRPDRAWHLLEQLGVDRRISRYRTLAGIVACAGPTADAESERPAVLRARWLWQRARHWVNLPWSELHLGDDDRQLLILEGGPLAGLLREHGSLRGVGPMSQGLFNYLRARWRLLPPAERELLLRWLRTRWRRYTVVETRADELVLADAYGRHHVAGAEDTRADRTWCAGDMISGWLLPTSAPDEHLIVLNTARAAWSP